MYNYSPDHEVKEAYGMMKKNFKINNTELKGAM